MIAVSIANKVLVTLNGFFGFLILFFFFFWSGGKKGGPMLLLYYSCVAPIFVINVPPNNLLPYILMQVFESNRQI